MKKYFEEYRAIQLKLLNDRGYDFREHNSVTTSDFSYGLINGWLKYIDEAFESIEYLKLNDYDKYEKLYNRILMESICPRYLMLRLYENTYSVNELNAQRKQFKEDCARVQLSEFSQYSSIAELWS
jgi:hypothetical protein